MKKTKDNSTNSKATKITSETEFKVNIFFHNLTPEEQHSLWDLKDAFNKEALKRFGRKCFSTSSSYTTTERK